MGIVGGFRRVSLIFSVVLFFVGALYADQDSSVRLRDRKAECGLYLTSLANDTMAVKVAEPNQESIGKWFDSKPDLRPKLIYVDKMTMTKIEDPAKIEQGQKDGTIIPIMDTPKLVLKGEAIPLFDVPLFDTRRGDLLKYTRARVQQAIPEKAEKDFNAFVRFIKKKFGKGEKEKIQVRAFGIPAGPLMPIQWIWYELMFLGQDIQSPTPFERQTTYKKLLASNGTQQVFIYLMNIGSPLVATSTGAVNFLNSYYTGIYTQTIANWMNRSRNGYSRLAKKFLLGAFFTVDLSMAATLNPTTFAKTFATGEGLKEFAISQTPNTLINLAWRYYYEESINLWQRGKETAKLLPGLARKTATDLKFWGSVVTVPAFLYAISHKGVGIPIEIGPFHFWLNWAHAWMGAIGTYGALRYFNVKGTNWDPWVPRLEKINSGAARAWEASRIPGLVRPAKEKIWQAWKAWREQRGKKEFQGATAEEVREFLAQDGNVSQALDEALKSNDQIRAAVEQDPNLSKLVKEISNQQEKEEAEQAQPPESQN